MKAVIINIRKNQAAALDDDGSVTKIKNNDYRIGQVIELKKATKKTAVWSAAAVMLTLIGFGAWSFFSPYTYVSLDVNPSIEYSVNRYGLVLSAEAVNGDGAEILSSLNLKFHNVDNALAETVDEIAGQGYFDGDDPGAVMIATSCKNDAAADKLCLRLQTRIQEMQQIRDCNVAVQGVSVGYDRVEEARTLGITPGKLNLIEKLKEASDDPDSITVEDWMNKPVKDIMRAINDNKGNGGGNSNGNGSAGSTDNGSGDSNGNGSAGSTDNGSGGSAGGTANDSDSGSGSSSGSGNGNSSDNGSGGSGGGNGNGKGK